MRGRFASMHVQRCVCWTVSSAPKEPPVSRDVLSPSLQHGSLQMRLSLLIYFQRKNGGSLFFWYTVLLKSPLKKTPWPRSHKKTGQWHAARPRCSLVVEYKQQEVLMRCCLIFNKVNFNTTTSRLWDLCVCLVCRGVLKAHAFPCRAHAPRTCKISSSESLHKRKCSSSPSSFSAHCRLAGWATPSPAPDRQSALTLWWSCLTIYGDEIAGLSLRPLVRPWGPKPQNQAKP